MFIIVEFALSVILHKPLKYSSTRMSINVTDNVFNEWNPVADFGNVVTLSVCV